MNMLSDYAAALDICETEDWYMPAIARGGKSQPLARERDPDGAALHRGRCVAVTLEQARARAARGEPPNWRLDLADRLPRRPRH